MPTELDPEDVQTTAKVLDAAVTAFIARESLKNGVKFSKRSISTSFLGDGLEASTLSRWTNPGEHRNWMIPTFRIPEVAELLTKGAPGESQARVRLTADLMTARIAEISHDPKNEAVVIATWLAGVLEPSADEAALAAVYQRVAGDYPHRIFDSNEALAEFEKFLRDKLKVLWAEFFAERSLNEDATDSAAVTSFKAKMKLEPAPALENSLLALTQEQRNADYSARYQANLAIRDVQAKLGIKPLRKIPKRRPK